MFLKKKSVFSKNLKNILILVLIGLLAISVWFNYVLYKNLKDVHVIIQSLEDDEDILRQSIIESLNNSCNNFENRNSTIMSLASILASSRVYMGSQFKLLYFFCDLKKEGEMCKMSSKNFNSGYNVFFLTIEIMKKYINNEITKDKFNSIVCNLTRYFENNNIEAIKKLRENV